MGFSSGQLRPENVDLDSSQTLENKTLDASTVIASGTDIQTPAIIDPTRLDVKKDTLVNLQTYALTADAGQIVYSTDTKQMFQVIDNVLAEVGGGSSGINYVTNPDLEQDISDYTGDVNLVISHETAAPLRGSGSLKITKGAVNAIGETVKTPFTVDTADLAKKLTITFDYDTSDANYADGDIKVEVIQDPSGAATVISVNGEDLLGGKNSYVGQFQTDHTELDYELRLTVNSTNATAYTILADNIKVGPASSGVSGTADSMIRLHTGNGHGSTNTTIRRFSTEVDSIGGAITYVDSATDGGSFTINEDGVYSISYNDARIGGGAQLGLSLNSSQLTTNIVSITAADILQTVYTAGGNLEGQLSWSGILSKGDVIRAHTDGQPDVALTCIFTITKQGTSASASSSGRDVIVTGAGNNGAVLSDNTVVNFTETADSTASFDGETFTAPETGRYVLDGAIAHTGGALNRFFTLDIDTGSGYSHLREMSPDVASSIYKIGATVDLNKGDKIQVKVRNGAITLSNSSTSHWLTITKLASSQTILDTETVAARYTSDSGQTLTKATDAVVVFEDLDFDTHNAMNSSTGIYTVPVSGIYDIASMVQWSGLAITNSVTRMLKIHVNGLERSTIFHDAGGSTATRGLGMNGSTKLSLEKGDEVSIRANQDSPTDENLQPNGNRNHVAIARVK